MQARFFHQWYLPSYPVQRFPDPPRLAPVGTECPRHLPFKSTPNEATPSLALETRPSKGLRTSALYSHQTEWGPQETFGTIKISVSEIDNAN